MISPALGPALRSPEQREIIGCYVASVGFYERAAGKKFARVQLLTIDGLLDGAEHPDYEPNLNFKKAKTESDTEQQDLI